MDALPAYMTGLLAVLLLSSFVKILTTLNIARYGIGLEGSAFGMVIIAISLGLSLLVMSPQVDQAGGVEALLGAHDSATLEKNFRPFIEKHTDKSVKDRFTLLAKKLRPATETTPTTPSQFPIDIAAFLISQVKDAFILGFMILVPFLVVDLLCANVLMAIGVQQLPVAVIALPLKILLFFAIDGWTLLSEKLINGYIS
jgi:type III secretion protein R